MKRYAIPGVFVGRSLTGVTRYSWEIIDQLDQLIEGKDITCLLYTSDAADD